MNYYAQLMRFQTRLARVADLAYIPPSADLQYLTGVPRSMPNYGNLIHPGDWVEGLWLTSVGEPELALSKMTVEFGGLDEIEHVHLTILADHGDHGLFLTKMLRRFKIGGKSRIAIGSKVRTQTIVALQESLPDSTFCSASDLLMTMRMVKSGDEIDAMRRAGDKTEASFQALLPLLKHGMTELDVLHEVTHQLRRQGSFGPSFDPVLYCSGPNHRLIFGKPELTQNRRLDPPVSVLFDFGAICQGYCYDYGRTVFFGIPDEEMKRIHQLVMDSQRAGIRALKANSFTAERVDAAARKVVDRGGYGREFRHRLGHGIGMDVHEPPFLTEGDQTELASGMLFTVEPSVTQFEGYSARVEDVVLVGDDGGIPLTSGFQDLIVV